MLLMQFFNIYQKYLLSESVVSKIEYLFLLEELFKKADLSRIYSKFLSTKIEEIGIENLPEEFQEVASTKIISDEDLLLGKVKYNDKILHQSRVLKYYVEGENKKKVQKDIDKISKVFVTDKPVKEFILDPFLETADTDRTNNYFPERNKPTRFEIYKNR